MITRECPDLNYTEETLLCEDEDEVSDSIDSLYSEKENQTFDKIFDNAKKGLIKLFIWVGCPLILVMIILLIYYCISYLKASKKEKNSKIKI